MGHYYSNGVWEYDSEHENTSECQEPGYTAEQIEQMEQERISKLKPSSKDQDHLFEKPPGCYKLKKGDRMRRTNPYSASSLDWFPVQEYDWGLRADYFNCPRSPFVVERRKKKVNEKSSKN